MSTEHEQYEHFIGIGQCLMVGWFVRKTRSSPSKITCTNVTSYSDIRRSLPGPPADDADTSQTDGQPVKEAPEGKFLLGGRARRLAHADLEPGGDMHQSGLRYVPNAGLGEPVEQSVFCRGANVARIRIADQRGEIFQPGRRRSGAATGKLWRYGRPGQGNAGIRCCRHSGFANDGRMVCCPVAPLSVLVLSDRRQVGFEAEGKG